MKAYITLKSIEVLPKKPEIFSIGGFTMVTTDGRTFMFDFEETSAGATLEESTGKYIFDCCLKERDVDVFFEENEEAGIMDEEITPKFITTSMIEEICYEYYLDVDHEESDEFCMLEVMDFSIEEGEECEEVPSVEIERYNKKMTLF
jgi:hypothetical protein